MKFKLWIIAAFVVAAILVVGALVLDLGAKSSGGPAAQSQLMVTPTPANSPAATTSASAPGTTKGKQEPARGDAAKQTNPSASPNAKGPQGATSVSERQKAPASPSRALEMPDKSTPTPHKLPKSKERVPAVSSMPKSGASRGKLVNGFPKKAVNLPPKASVVSSSLATQAKRLLVQLDARTTSSVKSVLSFYAADFAKKGWITSTGSAADGSRTIHGALAQDSAIVVVRELPTGQTGFSVSGAFMVDE